MHNYFTQSLYSLIYESGTLHCNLIVYPRSFPCICSAAFSLVDFSTAGSVHITVFRTGRVIFYYAVKQTVVRTFYIFL